MLENLKTEIQMYWLLEFQIFYLILMFDYIKDIKLQDKIDALISFLPREPVKEFLLGPVNKDKYNTFNTQVKEVLNPKQKMFYESFWDEFKETVYKSYWTMPLGQVPTPVPPLPSEFSTYQVAMGVPTGVCKGEIHDHGDVINPRLTAGQVLFQSEIGHELYKKSHNDFNLGERRHILCGVDRNITFGLPTNQEKSGRNAKLSMQWFDQSTYSATSKQLSSFKLRHHHQVGQVLAPNNNIEKVGEHYRFGILTKGDNFGASEILRGLEPNLERMELSKCLHYVNSLRILIKKFDPPFPKLDFQRMLNFTDEDKSGYLPAEVLSKICTEFNLKINFDRLWRLLERTASLKEAKVDYFKFCQLIFVDEEYPSIEPIKDIPKDLLHYNTTYQFIGKDLECNNTESMRTAGLTSRELWSLKGCPNAMTAVNQIHLGSETTASTCINPSVFVHYGLSHRDFFRPRTEVFIRNLFTKIGTEMSDEVFKELWKEGFKRDKTGFVSVETFRNLLGEVVACRFAQQFKH